MKKPMITILRVEADQMPEGKNGADFRRSATHRLIVQNEAFKFGMWSRENDDWVLKASPVEEEQRKAEDMPYRESIIARMDRQSEKGLQKYGGFLTENKLTTYQRLEHLAEELTDGLVYLEHIRADQQELVNEMTDVMADVMMISAEVLHNQDLTRSALSDSLMDVAGKCKNIMERVTNNGNNESGREKDSGSLARTN